MPDSLHNIPRNPVVAPLQEPEITLDVNPRDASYGMHAQQQQSPAPKAVKAVKPARHTRNSAGHGYLVLRSVAFSPQMQAPGQTAAVQTQTGIPAAGAPTGILSSDTAFNAQRDSLLNAQRDTTVPLHAIAISNPERMHDDTARANSGFNGDLSWIIAGLAAIFFIICLRFRKNHRYLAIMAHNLTNTRRRENLFDDTVRETTYLLLLNLMCLLSMGVMLYFGLLSFGLLDPSPTPARDIAICMGVCLVWGAAMWAFYWITGTVFYDAASARVWVRGYVASFGTMSLFMFLLALATLVAPVDKRILVWCAIAFYVAFKLIFILNGARIFCRRPSSIVIFLYYLCTLEIIPLIAVILGAAQLCKL